MLKKHYLYSISDWFVCIIYNLHIYSLRFCEPISLSNLIIPWYYYTCWKWLIFQDNILFVFPLFWCFSSYSDKKEDMLLTWQFQICFQHIWANMQFAAFCSTKHSLAPSAIIKIHYRKNIQDTQAWTVVYTWKSCGYPIYDLCGYLREQLLCPFIKTAFFFGYYKLRGSLISPPEE